MTALERFYNIPPHAPLLPFEVAALVQSVRELAAKRGASPEIVALAERVQKRS